MLTPQQLAEVKQVADQHKGHCPTCYQTIKFYTYPVNKQIMTVLRAMRDVVERTNQNRVNFDDIDLPYRLKSQRTKMRLHGLIARVKDPKTGHQVKNTWLITEKGGKALRGEPIPAKVEVYMNQMLGHTGGEVTFKRMDSESAYEEKPATVAEARVYGDARKPKKNLTVQAQCLTDRISGITKGSIYPLEIERLQVGKPVVVLDIVGAGRMPVLSYPDISAFARDWKVVGATSFNSSVNKS